MQRVCDAGGPCPQVTGRPALQCGRATQFEPRLAWPVWGHDGHE